MNNFITSDPRNELDDKVNIALLSDIAKKLCEVPNDVSNKKVSIKHISHLDLDGYGATILSMVLQKVVSPKILHLETLNILPNKLKEEIEKSIASIDDYDCIIITDLAMNQELINLINSCPQKDKFRVFDHHKCDVTDLPKNVFISEKSYIFEGRDTCATEMYYTFILQDMAGALFAKENDLIPKLNQFVSIIRAYDTFDFWRYRKINTNGVPESEDGTIINRDDTTETDIDIIKEYKALVDIIPEGYGVNIHKSFYEAPRLNTLFHIISRDEFINYVFAWLWGLDGDITSPRSECPLMRSPYKLVTDDSYCKYESTLYNWIPKIIDLENMKNQKYVDSAVRRVSKTSLKLPIFDPKTNKIKNIDMKLGVVFAEKSSPIIANTALELDTSLEVCAVVSNNQVSLYTNKPNVDVSAIAKLFGGGGHKNAAGFIIPYQNSSVFNLNHFADIIECAARLTPNSVELK